MGILSSIARDIETLVVSGYDDYYISKSVGEELNLIQYIINYFRSEHKPEKKNMREFDEKYMY